MLAKRRYLGTHVFLIVMGLIMVLPLVYMVMNAFKPYDELFLFPPRPWVRRPTLDNFGDLVMASGASAVPFNRYIFNSVFTSGITVGVILLLQSMAAYPLAKHRFPGRQVIRYMNMAAFMFAAQVVTIPRFLVVNALGLLNSYWALIIPNLAQPFMVFLLVQYMGQVPESLLESAKMDGGSEWFLYSRIVMPLIKPALATVLILTFITIWRDAFGPIIYLRNEALKTLPVALTTVIGGGGSIGRAGAAAAASFLMTAPVVVIFVMLQRHVLSTMAFSGIKE